LNCAIDCIISVISDNESILNNIADDIKINKASNEKEKKMTITNFKSINFIEFAKEKEVFNFFLNRNFKICFEFFVFLCFG